MRAAVESSWGERHRGPALASVIRGLVAHARTLAGDYALLAVLEARSAAVRLAWLVSAGLIAAVLLVTAWLALVTGGMVWMLGSGASWELALLVAAALNVVAAVAVIVWMRGLFAEMPFAAMLRQLKGEQPAAEPPL